MKNTIHPADKNLAGRETLVSSARGAALMQCKPVPPSLLARGASPSVPEAAVAHDALKEIQPARLRRIYFGVDNGFTGAIAGLGSQGEVLFQPVVVLNLGKEKLLDVDANLSLLRHMLGAAGGSPEQALAVFEQGQIAPRFGARNNYTNGKNNEFWRVLFTVARIPFTWVNPRVWQQTVFRGIRGRDTKVMAELVRRQRFPQLNLAPYNLSQREGINDAICIALWAQQTLA